MTLTEIVSCFDNVKQVNGNQYAVNCPACGDTNRHLYIGESNGKILLDCKHGCSFNDIVQASGIKKSEFFPPKQKAVSWTKLREHIYTNEQGNIIARKVIFDKGDGSKTAIWERYENGTYIKGLNGLKVPLYHVHNLQGGKSVFIAEGEKDVETIEKMKFRATCSPNGAGGRTSWVIAHNKYFTGKDVVILTDNDDAGREHGRVTAESLCGTAESVRLIPSEIIYPQLKEKGDISDIVVAVGLDEAKKLLMEAVQNAPVFKIESGNDLISSVGTTLNANKSIVEKLTELDPLKYHYSDRGSSELFADTFRHELRYNTTAKEWYYYDGKVWKIDNGSMYVHSKAKQFFDALIQYSVGIADEKQRQQFYSYYLKFGSKNKRDTLIKDAADCCYISSEDLDKNTKLFNCQNGTFELNTMKFREHRAEDYITKISNVVYDKNASYEVWEKFIGEVLPKDKDKVRYLQKALGYSLMGDGRLEKCFILYGATTRNGKSTVVGTMSYMLGNVDGYARSAQPEVLAIHKNRDSRAPSEDLARLAGCRFLNVSEPSQSMAFDAALLKSMTGRDIITARFLNQNSFEFVPQFTLFINTNYLPKVLDETLFRSNRISVIEFDRHFEPQEQDETLKDRLKSKENISGLFNWCLEGLMAFRTEGLKPPRSVAISTAAYEEQSDKLGNFISECLEEEPGKYCSAKDAYDVYKNWCAESRYYAEGKQKFLEMLRAKNMLANSGTVDGKTVRNVIRDYIINAQTYPSNNVF